MKSELQVARNAILKSTQAQAFADVLKVLLDQQTLENQSIVVPIKFLKESIVLKKVQVFSPCVFDGWLRVRGRLRNVDLPLKSKYPFLLPYQHLVTDLVIRQCHEKDWSKLCVGGV